MKVQITTDGKTVWVCDDTGCTIGRFSAAGVDVHATGPEQLKGDGSVCRDCTHGLPFDESWERFKSSMLSVHGVIVPDADKPKIRSVFGSEEADELVRTSLANAR